MSTSKASHAQASTSKSTKAGKTGGYKPKSMWKKGASKKGPAVWKKVNPNYLQLHIQLLEIEPPIWRRVIIADDFTFEDMHYLLQRIMPWHNSHMHIFHCTDKTSGADEDVGPVGIDHMGFDPETNPGIRPSHNTWLDRYLSAVGDQCIYEYDMGDSWEHLIEVEQVFEHNPNPHGRMIRVIDGARAAPPDDCGSVPGYENLLEVIADPNHEEHEEMMQWLEDMDYGGYDPEHFDLDEANEDLP